MKTTAYALSALLALVAASPLAHAISEADYGSRYESEVAPFYATGVSGSFGGVNGITIHYRSWVKNDERGAVVVVNGRTETYLKYAELAYDLSQAGYSVYMLDHRGQGLSDRLVKNPHVGYIRRFDEYVTDLKTFVVTVVNARPHAKRFMIGHSMGGAITALYNEAYPTDFDAVALSAPMLEVNTSPYPEWLAYDLASLLCAFGQGSAFAPGQKEHEHTGFEKNILTHSRARYEKSVEIQHAFPQTYLGGASNRWVQQSMKAATAAVKGAKNFAAPVLLFQAGADKLVRPGGQNDFCKKAPHCHEIALPGSYHEILMETDDIRDPALRSILAFFEKHLTTD